MARPIYILLSLMEDSARRSIVERCLSKAGSHSVAETRAALVRSHIHM